MDHNDKNEICSGLLESWPIKLNKGWQEVNILQLAYLGDAVYELWVRKHLMEQGVARVEDMHSMAIKYVCAKNQARLLRYLLEKLDETEKDVVKRGRNAKAHHPRNVDVITYKHATAFEALVGYWYLTDKKTRMTEVLNQVDQIMERLDANSLGQTNSEEKDCEQSR